MNDRWQPKTRLETSGVTPTQETDPNTGQVYLSGRTRSGRLVDKNRSDGWRGYKSHLTQRQRRLIAYALRQRARGCTREAVWEKIQPYWRPSPMQYPLTLNTVASWELTARAMASRGKPWPLPDTAP